MSEQSQPVTASNTVKCCFLCFHYIPAVDALHWRWHRWRVRR